MSTHPAPYLPHRPFQVPVPMPLPAFRMSSGELRHPGTNGRGPVLAAPVEHEDVHAQLQRERQRADALEATVAAFGIAMLALDRTGRVCHATAAANLLLAGNRGVTLRDGRLAATRTADELQLQQLLEDVLSGAPPAPPLPARARTPEFGRPVAVPNRSAEPTGTDALDGVRLQGNPAVVPLHVSVMRTPHRADSTAVAALVFLHEGRMTLPSRGTLLRSLYGVTPTQARLADLLLNGRSVREAADAMGIAEDTARFHLKSLFRITGAANQSALLRLMLSLPGEL